jgi:prepilin-type N-terminal cleavage/methylation domain-containing protein
MAQPSSFDSASAGFTLIEVLVALSLMLAISAGVGRLFVVAGLMGRASRDRTMAVVLASGKLEQLRSLAWDAVVEPSGTVTRVTDAQTNVGADPPAAGGPGLAESPPGTLDDNIPPFVDFLDRLGSWVGSGSSPPRGAVYIRRWSVHHAPWDPDQLVALQVLVTTVAREHARPRSVSHAWNGDDVVMATMKTRVAR